MKKSKIVEKGPAVPDEVARLWEKLNELHASQASAFATELSVKTALILIDIQNDYFPGGKLEVANSTGAGAAARQVLDYFRQQGFPLLHIRHISLRPDAAYLLPDTPGSEIHESVKPLPGEPVFIKHYPNSFRDTSLLSWLKVQGAQRLVIAGMMTHMCIDSTTRAAFDNGFECLLVKEACATRALKMDGVVVPAEQVQAAFLSALSPLFARLVTVEEVRGIL